MGNPYSTGAAFPDLSPTINNFYDNMVRLKIHDDNMNEQARRLEAERPFREARLAEQTMKNEELQRQAQIRRQPVDMTVHPSYISLPDEVKPQVLDFFQKNGYINERGMGTVDSLSRGLQVIESSKPLFESFMGPVVAAKKQGVINAYNEVLKAQETGDQEKIKKASLAFDKVNMDYQASAGNFDKHLTNLSNQDAKMAALEQKFANQKELQDAKYNSMRDLKLVSAAGGSGRSGGRGTEFDRDYQGYLDYAAKYYPNMRPMTRGEYKIDQDRQRKENSAANRPKKESIMDKYNSMKGQTGGGAKRDQAIQILKSKGARTTEANINYIMRQL